MLQACADDHPQLPPKQILIFFGKTVWVVAVLCSLMFFTVAAILNYVGLLVFEVFTLLYITLFSIMKLFKQLSTAGKILFLNFFLRTPSKIGEIFLYDINFVLMQWCRWRNYFWFFFLPSVKLLSSACLSNVITFILGVHDYDQMPRSKTEPEWFWSSHLISTSHNHVSPSN